MLEERRHTRRLNLRNRTLSLVALFLPTLVAADGGVTFTDVTAASGIDYRRVPSVTIASLEALFELDPILMTDIPSAPLKGNGAPGVALIDYDNDGDLDVFVPNGPGADHSLYVNQLADTGTMSFLDQAVEAGVAAREQDGTGVCFGDIDNDGDHDLLVLGRAEPHRLFVNNGDGTFADKGSASGLGIGRGSASCAMGDVDGDGLLDVSVANTYDDWSTFLPIIVIPFELNAHNDLYVNQGGNVFSEEAEARGLHDVARVLAGTGIPEDAATITWSVTMVDYDYDGDADILYADDQAVVPGARRGGADRGYVQLFDNDGSGHFTNLTREAGLDIPGHYMSFSWGDFDCNGALDFLSTNVGDYIYQILIGDYVQNEWATAWYLGQPDHRFTLPGVGDLVATPWGWGSSVFDYDNDGDSDLVFQGALNMGFVAALDNPGTILRNPGCSARFVWDQDAMDGSVDHTRRGVEGLATGDLNGDGFPDMVSVSGFDVPADQPLLPMPVTYGGPFEDTALFAPVLTPVEEGVFIYEGFQFAEGTLSLELNSGGNGNHWIAVETRGSLGITGAGVVNRDGIGAVVLVTPRRGKTAIRPVESGTGYASQDALIRTFGLGSAKKATVEVLWPGGVRNRLDGVKPGTRVLFPEIPCSFDGDWEDEAKFEECVEDALDQLVERGILNEDTAEDFEDSMEDAFEEVHGDEDD